MNTSNLHQRRMRYASSVAAVPFLLLLSFLLAGCAGSAELSSWWNSNDVVVDGNANEWTSHTYFINDAHISIGVRNDSDCVYICLMSSENQFRRQMIAPGMTVWLQPDGGERLGIHYPVGIPKRRSGENQGEENDERMNEPIRMRDQALQDVEILGPDEKDRQLYTTMTVPGIGVSVGTTGGSAAYELKVPLKKSKDRPLALGMPPGGILHLSIESGNFEKSDRGEGMRGGRRGRGGRSHGGDISPGEGAPQDEQPEETAGAQRPSSGNSFEPLNFEAKVTLAKSQSGDAH